MKILYVARIYYSRAELLRSKTLEELGHELIQFNMYTYEKQWGRYVNWFLRRCSLPHPAHILMNQRLITIAYSAKPDVVWIDKGSYIYPSTLKKIKQLTGAFILSETADNMLIQGNRTKAFIQSIPYYDLMVTDKNPQVVRYSDYGAKEVLSIHKGYYPALHKPVDLTPEERIRYEADVVFCGTPEKERAQSLAYLIQHGIKVKIWGNPRTWKRMPHYQVVKPCHMQKALWYDEYVKAVNGAKIALCFLRHISGDTQTQRTFELPACGTLTIAERTNDHKGFFEEDKEMVFFSNDVELLEKVSYYLEHTAEREMVAQAGRNRCERSNYTYHRRYRDICSEIDALRTRT